MGVLGHALLNCEVLTIRKLAADRWVPGCDRRIPGNEAAGRPAEPLTLPCIAETLQPARPTLQVPGALQRSGIGSGTDLGSRVCLRHLWDPVRAGKRVGTGRRGVSIPAAGTWCWNDSLQLVTPFLPAPPTSRQWTAQERGVTIQPGFQGRVCYAGKQGGVESLAGTTDWTGKVRAGSAGTCRQAWHAVLRTELCWGCTPPARRSLTPNSPFVSLPSPFFPPRGLLRQHIVIMGSGSFAIEAAEAAAKRNAKRVAIVSRPRYRHAHGL